MSNPLEYTLHKDSVTVITGDGEIHTLNSGTANFDRIRDALVDGFNDKSKELTDDDYYTLLHFKTTNPLTRLSGRISYDEASDTILLDNNEIRSALGDYIRELHTSRNPQLNAFVNFMERLEANPTKGARDELFNWIDTLVKRGEKLTITPDGKIIAYKGVLIDEDGDPASINKGPGFIDGVYQNGHLKNRVGSVVEVSRDYVDANHRVGCSRGLHAGTYSYAKGFSQGMLLRVEIDPMDVVSVPKDCAWQKIRCCRYTVIEVNDVPETLPVVRGTSADWSETDMELWASTGYTVTASEVYRNRGYTLEEALELESDGGGIDNVDSVSMSDWLGLGFNIVEVAKLKAAGITFEQADEEDYDYSILDEDEDEDYDEDGEDTEEELSKDSVLDSNDNVQLNFSDSVNAAKEALKKAKKASKKKAKKKAKKAALAEANAENLRI